MEKPDVEASTRAATAELDRITAETLGAQLSQGTITWQEALGSLLDYVTRSQATPEPSSEMLDTQEFPQVRAAE